MKTRCPLKKNVPPCENCPLGQNTFKTMVKTNRRCQCKNPGLDLKDKTMTCSTCRKVVVTCNWAIKSAKHNFCFWTYADSEDGHKCQDGKTIEKMLNITEQRVGQIVKELILYIRSRSDLKEIFKKRFENE